MVWLFLFLFIAAPNQYGLIQGRYRGWTPSPLRWSHLVCFYSLLTLPVSYTIPCLCTPTKNIQDLYLWQSLLCWKVKYKVNGLIESRCGWRYSVFLGCWTVDQVIQAMFSMLYSWIRPCLFLTRINYKWVPAKHFHAGYRYSVLGKCPVRVAYLITGESV